MKRVLGAMNAACEMGLEFYCHCWMNVRLEASGDACNDMRRYQLDIYDEIEYKMKPVVWRRQWQF